MRKLDRTASKAGDSNSASHLEKKNNSSANNEPTISAPVRNSPSISTRAPHPPPLPHPPTLLCSGEADGLSEILRNQSHPTNLVAVKKDQTPILQEPRLGCESAFSCQALKMNSKLSSRIRIGCMFAFRSFRGWLRRSLVGVFRWLGILSNCRCLCCVCALPSSYETARRLSCERAHVFGEQRGKNGSFPGSWEPLKGKTVKIVSVQAAAGRTTADKKN